MKTFRIVLFFAALLLAVSACQEQRPSSTAQREKITIACMKNQLTSGLVITAKNRGYFDKAGLDVTLQLHDYGKLALDSMLDGKADLSMAAETPIMINIMKGKKIAILSAVSVSSENEMVLGRKESGIRSANDLKGKRIGVVPTTSADYQLDAILTNGGLSREDVTTINLQPAEMPDALQNGRVDAVSIWNLPLLQMRNQLGAKGVSLSDKTLYTEFICLLTTREYAVSHPEALIKVMKALVMAEDFIKKHSDEAMKDVAATATVDIKLAEQIWNIYDFSVTLNQSLPIALADEARWAIKRKMVQSADMPDFTDYLYPDALTAVKPAAVRIIR
ncbi:MAG: transporter substrate-binding domain-containing protein [Geobacter sp.]|nr:transporter substrate-binding domain-containing protein [Geobacter sp.]